MQLIVLGLAACATASGSSYQRVWRQDGYDRVPTEYGVRVNGYNAYVDEPKFGRLGKRDASGESYQRVWRVDGYDQVPTEYGVRVNGYNAVVDEDRVGRLGKRSTPYAPALAYHPAGYGYAAGYSYTDRSPQGLHKRSTYGYTPALAYHPAGGYGYSKYGPGYSYTYRSTQGLHKREAEPSYAPALAYHPAGGYGYSKYGPGYSYVARSPQGLHKREASGTSYQTVERADCYGYNCQNSQYDVKVAGYNGDVDERRDGYNFAFNYGFDI